MIAFTLYQSVLAQRSQAAKFELTGTLVSVVPVRQDGKVFFDVRIFMQFRNDSDAPAIVFNPHTSSFFGERKIDFYKSFDAESGGQGILSKTVHWDNSWYRINAPDFDPMASFAKSLDAPRPSSWTFVFVEPRGYYEFHEKLRLESGYKLSEDVSKLPPLEWENIAGLAIPDHPTFRIRYHLSIKKHHPNSDLLRDLRERWKPYGYLVLDSNGDFTVQSDLIINKSNK